jgi:hypothetical protein
MTRDEQREAEMRRGAEVATRHEAEVAPVRLREDRAEILARLVTAKKLHIMVRGKNKFAYLSEVRLGDHIAAEVDGPAFPSEQFTANCILAVEALAGWSDIPDESPQRAVAMSERRRRDTQREQNARGGWKALYEK